MLKLIQWITNILHLKLIYRNVSRSLWFSAYRSIFHWLYKKKNPKHVKKYREVIPTCLVKVGLLHPDYSNWVRKPYSCINSQTQLLHSTKIFVLIVMHLYFVLYHKILFHFSSCQVPRSFYKLNMNVLILLYCRSIQSKEDSSSDD